MLNVQAQGTRIVGRRVAAPVGNSDEFKHASAGGGTLVAPAACVARGRAWPTPGTCSSRGGVSQPGHALPSLLCPARRSQGCVANADERQRNSGPCKLAGWRPLDAGAAGSSRGLRGSGRAGCLVRTFPIRRAWPSRWGRRSRVQNRRVALARLRASWRSKCAARAAPMASRAEFSAQGSCYEPGSSRASVRAARHCIVDWARRDCCPRRIGSSRCR
mmetsp:Transcript_17290/g.65488  ORF Transcript_17290/g.65488 Transcript_17290/m.65488 type:complete len:217 (+) Transcript_17290:2417-3067(+)